MSIFRGYPIFYALTLSAALFVSACTVQLPAPSDAGGAQAPVSNISAEMPYETQFVEVLGSQMAYVEAGEGDPILFLHGNPTSKYLWRNIMPHLEDQGRVIAPDLIGMGESDKPDIGYTFVEHAEYIQGFIDTMGLENVTLVIHDWGSGLGFDYASRNPDNVKAIAFMEAAVAPAFPPVLETMSPEVQQFMQGIRTPGVGEKMILEGNAFVAQFLPRDVRRGLTEEEMAVYLAPYPDVQSRLPTLVWPRQIPFDGEPTDVAERVAVYNEWFLSSELPKLHLYVSPGAIFSVEAVAELQAMNVPNYEAVYIGEGGHFIQEDHPEAIGRNISHWYHRISMADMAGDSSADMSDEISMEISAEMPYETQFVEINGSQMAYVEAGAGDPILFIHGNPTSKYLWRNIMPHLEGMGRVIAPDLIGMGESDKPDIGYTFVEHAEYLQSFVDTMGLENVTLVIHDWGSGLGFDYANRNRDNVKAIAFMEAAITPGFPPVLEKLSPENVQFLEVMKTEGMGEEMMLNQNMMIEQFLTSDIRRGLTEEEMAVYRAPFPDLESRKPMLVWVRSIPVNGEPADVAERVAAYNEWFLTSELPKLHFHVTPGAIISPESVEWMKAAGIPNYESIFLGEGGHFIQEDYPHEIGQGIAEWYGRIN